MKENEPRMGEKNFSRQRTPADTNLEDSLDMVEIFYMLLSHWWQIILAAVLCAALTFGYTYYRISPTYRATAKMFLASTSSTSSLLSVADLQWGTNMKADYQQLLKSRPLLESVIDSLDLNYAPSTLSNMISITNPENTRILCVTVTSRYPDEAADVANELINQCRIYLPEIMKMDAPSFYESALVPTYKAGPNYANNTMLGAAAGAAACCALFVVLYLLNDRLITPDDVTKYLGVQPLASIPEAYDNGGSYGYSRKRKSSQQEPSKPDGEAVEKKLSRFSFHKKDKTGGEN